MNSLSSFPVNASVKKEYDGGFIPDGVSYDIYTTTASGEASQIIVAYARIKSANFGCTLFMGFTDDGDSPILENFNPPNVLILNQSIIVPADETFTVRATNNSGSMLKYFICMYVSEISYGKILSG